MDVKLEVREFPIDVCGGVFGRVPSVLDVFSPSTVQLFG